MKIHLSKKIEWPISSRVRPWCTMAGMTAVRAGDLGTFDLTIANILAAPLVRLHAILANLTRPGDGNLSFGVICQEELARVLR